MSIPSVYTEEVSIIINASWSALQYKGFCVRNEASWALIVVARGAEVLSTMRPAEA
jgi:hypothetical protein